MDKKELKEMLDSGNDDVYDIMFEQGLGKLSQTDMTFLLQKKNGNAVLDRLFESSTEKKKGFSLSVGPKKKGFSLSVGEKKKGISLSVGEKKSTTLEEEFKKKKAIHKLTKPKRRSTNYAVECAAEKRLKRDCTLVAGELNVDKILDGINKRTNISTKLTRKLYKHRLHYLMAILRVFPCIDNNGVLCASYYCSKKRSKKSIKHRLRKYCEKFTEATGEESEFTFKECIDAIMNATVFARDDEESVLDHMLSGKTREEFLYSLNIMGMEYKDSEITKKKGFSLSVGPKKKASVEEKAPTEKKGFSLSVQPKKKGFSLSVQPKKKSTPKKKGFSLSVRPKKKAPPKRTKEIKLPLSTYMIFVQETRPTIVKENSDVNFTVIGKKLGVRWSQLSDAEKQVFVEKSQRDKERYNREMSERERSERESKKVDFLTKVGGIVREHDGKMTEDEINEVVLDNIDLLKSDADEWYSSADGKEYWSKYFAESVDDGEVPKKWNHFVGETLDRLFERDANTDEKLTGLYSDTFDEWTETVADENL